MVKEKISRFNKEFKKAISTAIIAAFGFIIALAWRDVINEYLINKVNTLSPAQGLLISAILITVVSVIGIMIISKLNTEN